MPRCRDNWRRKRTRCARNLQKNKQARLRFALRIREQISELLALGVINTF